MQSKLQEERLDYLLREFKEDSGRYRDMEVGEGYEIYERELKKHCE